MNDLSIWKEELEQVQIPKELDMAIRDALERGKKDKKKEGWRNRRSYIKWASIAVCVLSFMGSITMAVSPSTTAWAMEKIEYITKYFWVPVKTEDGYKVKRVEGKQRVDNYPKTVIAKDLNDASEKMGFTIKEPTYIPYESKRVSFIVNEDKSMVYIGYWFDRTEWLKDGYDPRMDGHWEINVFNTNSKKYPFPKEEELKKLKKTKIENQEVYIEEQPILLSAGSEKVPPELKIKPRLFWREGNVVYTIIGLSEDYLIKVAKSMINNKKQ